MHGTIPIYAACFYGFLACCLAFGLGGMVGKEIGRKHAELMWRPKYFAPKDRRKYGKQA